MTTISSPPSGGLRGQSVGTTAISTVGKAGVGLTYRGYAIEDLAEKASFEEVGYLMLEGELPKKQQLDDFKKRLRAAREVPPLLREVLERTPKDAHPMDVLRTGTSMLGVLEPEGSFARQNAVAERLLACLPSILCYWYRFAQEGVRIETESDQKNVSGDFLKFLHGG